LPIPNYLLPETKPVVCQFDMIRNNHPKMKISKSSIRESAQVDFSGMCQLFPLRFFYHTCKLYSPDSSDAPGLEGDSTCNCRAGKKFRTMAGCRISGDDKNVVFLVPGIEARCAPWSALTYGGNAQKMMPAQKGLYALMQFYSFHLNVSMVNPASVSTLSTTVITSCSMVWGLL